MKTSKLAKCECSPISKFTKKCDITFDEIKQAVFTYHWQCTNCGNRKPVGSSKKASDEKIQSVIDLCIDSIKKTGSERFPFTIEHKKEVLYGGIISLSIRACQAHGSNSALEMYSQISLIVFIKPSGGWDVIHVSHSSRSTGSDDKAKLAEAKRMIKNRYFLPSTLFTSENF